MNRSYSDIKRYDIDPTYLFSAVKTAIEHLGWAIKEEAEPELMADIPRVNGYPAVLLRVKVCYGYLKLTCENDEMTTGNPYSRMVVTQLLQTLDQHIEAIPKEQLRSLKETYKLTFK